MIRKDTDNDHDFEISLDGDGARADAFVAASGDGVSCDGRSNVECLSRGACTNATHWV